MKSTIQERNHAFYLSSSCHAETLLSLYGCRCFNFKVCFQQWTALTIRSKVKHFEILGQFTSMLESVSQRYIGATSISSEYGAEAGFEDPVQVSRKSTVFTTLYPCKAVTLRPSSIVGKKDLLPQLVPSIFLPTDSSQQKDESSTRVISNTHLDPDSSLALHLENRLTITLQLALGVIIALILMVSIAHQLCKVIRR